MSIELQEQPTPKRLSAEELASAFNTIRCGALQQRDFAEEDISDHIASLEAALAEAKTELANVMNYPGEYFTTENGRVVKA